MNVVYAIKCPCGKMYIGKTERKIKIRITEHKSRIRNENMTSPLVAHWKEARHTISQLRYFVIEQLLWIQTSRALDLQVTISTPVIQLKAGSHSLRYSFSFLSEPLTGVPQYSMVGYVDEVPIIGFTSESRRAESRALWMENVTDEQPKYWEERTVTFQEVELKLSNSLRDLMEQKNQVQDRHVLQMMLGCDLREDGSVKWFERFAYDGSNLTATLDPSSDTEDQGNSEKSSGCKKELKQLLKYGEESLLRRVAPQTRVSQRMSSDRAFLMGYAYGFYPRDIEVRWVRDGVEMPWESKELLPNPDGTYQVRTAVEVQEGDDVKTYEYHVNHSSLTEIVPVEYGKYTPLSGEEVELLSEVQGHVSLRGL
ncbi:H-2 class I histocompatibility antigen, Q7 alpha chain [Lissotriton helveticus]